MPNVGLTSELESFAAHCVQTGRYANVREVARAALRLLQQAEQQRLDFVAMLQEAEAEGDAIGFTTVGALGTELDTHAGSLSVERLPVRTVGIKRTLSEPRRQASGRH